MSKIVIDNEYEKTHTFYDIHDNQEDTFCIVKINVKKFHYSNNSNNSNHTYDRQPIFYYDITYSYSYIDNSIDITKICDFNPYSKLTIQKTNPFYYYRDKIADDSLEGVIALCNRVTTALVEQLLMNDSDLQKELSNKWVVEYRAHLMYILSTLWD
tara:strand:- start:228 stop:695 length:468 start_codon:yes stop_codon:yes gene_type:complete